MRVPAFFAVLWFLVIAIPSWAQAPQPPGSSCHDQLNAAGVLIPRLEWSRRDLEHSSAHEISKRDRAIQGLSDRIRQLEAENAKLKAAAAPVLPEPPPPRGSE